VNLIIFVSHFTSVELEAEIFTNFITQQIESDFEKR
jgi:hypothetical protein